MSHHILDTIDKDSKVIFYPSSCDYSEEFQDVPYDVVILNSNIMGREAQKGKVYCLNYDNNELLGLFLVRGIRISAIVIICDGCVEGGNYECVAGDGFFGRLMPVMAEKFDFFCDHQAITLEPFIPIDVPAHFDEFETPNYLEPFKKHSDPLNNVKSFHVTTFSVTEKELVLGRIRVKIIRDSIWRDYNQSDLVIVKKIGSSKDAIPNYLRGLLPNGNLVERFEFVTQPRMSSISNLLQKAEEKQLSRLSFIPIAQGSYRKIANEIQSWSKDYPKEIFFYHLNGNDFEYLKSL